ncbi:MAG TPA: 23S rRNA (pseudouridine(1915)-N(3))-methyltransferase RlmH [Paludibacteraceae bacterium]|nr:23S rRNA (pseudouridine(1915)-N(3))-methyltransferase RlmH [Paludibacteraceae bacterium]HPD27102.1 23S rRNA (pseudouridine(1915)-N(3))-methyltransferase RlmH [Paludibacteraceae bacterium]HRR58073.1 23S rRNA (pseudouridine(1915)-N(3))-methyltransferase RlmH [Paludibacteraceae bacterium]HRU72575.1 23S rRNA (pseudouridine(1915)-N(3))-methyltransferase RlmH [Paludibacteraceae bacterium]
MKILFLCVGKTNVSYFEEATNVYAKRLSHYCSFKMEFVPDVKNAKALSEQILKKMEGDAILKQIENNDTVILLDNNGVEFSSMEFAKWLETKRTQAVKRIVFVTGGAFGFSEEVYHRADGLLSLSRLTFSHQMIRPMFVEQLYRAMTIIKGEPYHHEATLWQSTYNKMK